MSRRSRRRRHGKSNKQIKREIREREAKEGGAWVSQFRQRICKEQRKEFAFRRVLSARASELRERATPAERALYDALMHRGVDPQFQYPLGWWIVDFLIPERRVIIEVDGGYHEDPQQRQKDREREQALVGRGYRIIRFKNEEVLAAPEAAVDRILVFSKPVLIQGALPPLREAPIIPCDFCAKRVRLDRDRYRELNGILHICKRMTPAHA